MNLIVVPGATDSNSIIHCEFLLTLHIFLFQFFGVWVTYVFMLSEIFLTKLILQHILYPTGGNTYEQQNQNLNHLPSGNNYFQIIVPNTKNDPVYEVKSRFGVSAYDTGQNGESVLLMYCIIKNIHKEQNVVLTKESYMLVKSNRISLVVINSEQ